MAKNKSCSVCNELAINGGEPVRNVPLPLEFPGGHFIGTEEIDAVCDVLRRKSPFRYYGLEKTGQCESFEREFAAFCGRKFALGVNSGTAALSIALAALGVGPGQEVLVPGYLWVSTVAAIVRAGAMPVLVDVDDTFCMDPLDMANKITSRTSTILVVHMSGAPGNVDEILAIAKQKNLKVLADCAQANGSAYKGKAIGGYGDIAIFSLQLNKNMTTGEGGVLVCDDEHLYKRAFACHDMGYARNDAGRLDPSDSRYQLWGMGSRMTEITAAMARVQLDKLPRIISSMRTAKYTIRKSIGDIKGIKLRLIADEAGDSGAFIICTFRTPQICDTFIAALRAEGIAPPALGCSNIPMSQWGLHIYYNITSLVNKTSVSADGYPWTHPLNKSADYAYGKGTLKNLDDLVSRSSIMAVPLILTQKDINDIVTAFHKVAGHITL
jgi:8-amino-3,8-dideoxy-alpha-D-manno-octulosonate transaminase